MESESILKYYNLFLDDNRDPMDCLEHMHDDRYATEEWIIVRSHEEFVQLIEQKWKNREFISLVSFDHDLHDEHYDPSMFKGLEAYENAYKKFQYPTGRRSALFLFNFCIENKLPFPNYIIHTMNPAGRERIQLAIDKTVNALKSNNEKL